MRLPGVCIRLIMTFAQSPHDAVALSIVNSHCASSMTNDVRKFWLKQLIRRLPVGTPLYHDLSHIIATEQNSSLFQALTMKRLTGPLWDFRCELCERLYSKSVFHGLRFPTGILTCGECTSERMFSAMQAGPLASFFGDVYLTLPYVLVRGVRYIFTRTRNFPNLYNLLECSGLPREGRSAVQLLQSLLYAITRLATRSLGGELEDNDLNIAFRALQGCSTDSAMWSQLRNLPLYEFPTPEPHLPSTGGEILDACRRLGENLLAPATAAARDVFGDNADVLRRIRSQAFRNCTETACRQWSQQYPGQRRLAPRLLRAAVSEDTFRRDFHTVETVQARMQAVYESALDYIHTQRGLPVQLRIYRITTLPMNPPVTPRCQPTELVQVLRRVWIEDLVDTTYRAMGDSGVKVVRALFCTPLLSTPTLAIPVAVRDAVRGGDPGSSWSAGAQGVWRGQPSTTRSVEGVPQLLLTKNTANSRQIQKTRTWSFWVHMWFLIYKNTVHTRIHKRVFRNVMLLAHRAHGGFRFDVLALLFGVPLSQLNHATHRVRNLFPAYAQHVIYQLALIPSGEELEQRMSPQQQGYVVK